MTLEELFFVSIPISVYSSTKIKQRWTMNTKRKTTTQHLLYKKVILIMICPLKEYNCILTNGYDCNL